MQKCESCYAMVFTSHEPHVKVEVAGADTYFCNSKCLTDWQQQNMVFIAAADPFAHRRHTHSEHRRKRA